MATLKVNAITPSSGTALTITAATASISGTLTVPNITGTASLATNATNAANLSTVISGLPVVATGSSTAIPVITVSNKGLTTVLTTAAVVAPAGTLSGATLAGTVTGSSLTSVGTLTALNLGTTAVLTNNNTTDSTAYTNGSVIIKGGLGIAGNIYLNSSLYSASSVSASTIEVSGLYLQKSNGTIVATGGYNNTFTQATSKATAVAVGQIGSGKITTFNTALAANTAVSFNVTHSWSQVASMRCSIVSGATVGAYLINCSAATTTYCTVTIRNLTAGSLSEAIVFLFDMDITN